MDKRRDRIDERMEQAIHCSRPWSKGQRAPLVFVAALLLIFMMIISAYAVRETQCRTYVLTDGERYETVKMYPGSVEQACREAGFEGYSVSSERVDGDTVYVSLDETFDVAIRTAEGSFTVRTAPCTVGEVLENSGVAVDADDIVTPEPDDWISRSGEITVTRVDYRTETEVQEIPFEVEMRDSVDMLTGETKVAQAGQKGETEIEYRIILHDGEEFGRETVAETVLTPVVNCVIERGIREPQNTQEQAEADAAQPAMSTAALPVTTSSSTSTDSDELATAGRSQVWSVPAGITDDTENKIITAADGSSFRYTSVIEVTATAYHRVEDGGTITASGTTTQYGTIAVDPSVIPLGSRLYVVSDGGDQSWSYGPGLAEDTGGLIKGDKIDLFFMTGSEAEQFGIRPAKVYILAE